MLGREDPGHPEPVTGEDVDGVAAVGGHRGGVSDEPQPPPRQVVKDAHRPRPARVGDLDPGLPDPLEADANRLAGNRGAVR